MILDILCGEHYQMSLFDGDDIHKQFLVKTMAFSVFLYVFTASLGCGFPLIIFESFLPSWQRHKTGFPAFKANAISNPTPCDGTLTSAINASALRIQFTSRS